MSMKGRFMLRFKDGYAKIMSFSNVFNVYVLLGIWFVKKIWGAGIRRTMCVCALQSMKSSSEKSLTRIEKAGYRRLKMIKPSENEL